MKVLAHVAKAVPQHNAGAEWTLHELLKDLLIRGHDVAVLADHVAPQSFQGVQIVDPRREWHVWADVVITQLDETPEAVEAARLARRPLVHLIHNDRHLARYALSEDDAALVVFNSDWLAAAHADWPGRSIVVRPPVFAADYRVDVTGEAITLVNLMERKGAGTFFELARRMPDRPFLAVLGAYGAQVTPGDVSNVTFMTPTPEAREIYRQTRILVMPSVYESWGRVAIEAAASGIPTIAHPTPGLLESLGSSGTFLERDDVDAWEAEITALDNPFRYGEAAFWALRRSKELDPTDDLDRFEAELLEVVGPCSTHTPRSLTSSPTSPRSGES